MASLSLNALSVLNAATAIDAAIVAKGGTLVAGGGLNNALSGIQSISTGFQLPYGWPDLKAIFNADSGHGYAHKVYMLYNTECFPTVNLRGNYHFITSDGSEYSSPTTHTWSLQAVLDGFGWIAIYFNDQYWLPGNHAESYNSSTSRLLWVISSAPIYLQTYVQCFQYCECLRMIDCPSIKFGSQSNLQRMFFSCSHLTFNNDIQFDMSETVSLNGVFAGMSTIDKMPDMNLSSVVDCQTLFMSLYACTSIPEILDVSHATTVAHMFNSCKSLPKLPQTLNFSSVIVSSNQNSCFDQMYCLRTLPEHMTSNWSLSFPNSTGITKDSLSAFIDGINICPNNGLSLKFHTNVKNNFTAEEQELISATCNAKNWTLIW